jgi:hypothetical protein
MQQRPLATSERSPPTDTRPLSVSEGGRDELLDASHCEECVEWMYDKCQTQMLVGHADAAHVARLGPVYTGGTELCRVRQTRQFRVSDPSTGSALSSSSAYTQLGTVGQQSHFITIARKYCLVRVVVT